ncbi:hypothetical protein TDB9533_02712 [Thalassocella blandensis]|nr:hypothetical protein TDB9533_02712 [Thalassocella blandensis]
MNASKWPSIDQLNPLIEEISRRLTLAEMQLRSLGEMTQTGQYDRQDSLHLIDLLQTNLDLELDISEYTNQLNYWENQERLTAFQKGEINYANTRLDRLAVVNVNIIRLSQSFLEHVESAETIVSGIIKRLQFNARP